MSLAIFDLDHTLLSGDSDHAWGEYLVDKGLVDGEQYRRENERFYSAYREGTLDILEFLGFALAPLTHHDQVTLDAWHRDFMESRIRPMITDASRALVEKHRQRGDTLLIITATNRFITGPIAAAFGIPNLLATDPEQRDGRYTGKVAGIPCYREGKVTRLNAWLAEQGGSLDGAWFYSDSHNDLPLLGTVTHPVAVDPDPILRKHAESAGWPILLLHSARTPS